MRKYLERIAFYSVAAMVAALLLVGPPVTGCRFAPDGFPFLAPMESPSVPGAAERFYRTIKAPEAPPAAELGPEFGEDGARFAAVEEDNLVVPAAAPLSPSAERSPARHARRHPMNGNPEGGRTRLAVR